MIRNNGNPSRKIAFREDTIMNKKEKKGVTKVTIVQTGVCGGIKD